MPLYVVATPIGNMEDITRRAVRVLSEADLIAAEDTRKTGLLLKRCEIATPMVSCHEHNEARRTAEIVGRVAAGEAVAIVSNAGTPAFSDPGYRVIRGCIDAGLEVIPIPGACAAVAALSASGLPANAFYFAGFPPKKPGKRRKALEHLAGLGVTVILYESPFRIVKLLADIREVMGERHVCLGREITKKFEEFLRGTPAELLAHFEERPPKGEFVVIVAPGGWEPG